MYSNCKRNCNIIFKSFRVNKSPFGTYEMYIIFDKKFFLLFEITKIDLFS